MSRLIRHSLTSAAAVALGIAGAVTAAGPALAATSLAETGSTGLPVWVPVAGGIVLLAGIGFVVFSAINRRKVTGGAVSPSATATEGDPGPGTGGDAVFPEASSAPPTAEPPAEFGSGEDPKA